MEKENRSELALLRETLWGTIDSEAQRFKVCLLTTFLLGLIAHGYGFLNFTINDDSLYEFYLSVCMDWKLQLGRFMEPLLRFVMGEAVVLPWLTGIVGLLFAGAAMHLISKMFRLDTVWENLLLCGICITNTTVISLIATFIHDFCGDMLALLLSVCAAYAWYRMKERFSWKQTIWGAACLAGSVGFYQTYPAVTVTLIVIDTIRDLLEGKSVKAVVRDLVKAIPMAVLAVLGYVFCVMVSFQLFDTARSDVYAVKLVRDEDPLRLFELKRIYQVVWRDFFQPNGGVWAGVQGVFKPTAVVICGANILLAAVTVLNLVFAFRKKQVKLPGLLLALLLLALLPACMMWATILSGWFHHVMRYAVCLFYLLILVIFKSGAKILPGKWGRRQLSALLAAAVILISSNVQLANTAYIKKDVERQASMSTMTRVLSMLEQYEGYEYNRSKVAIIGQINRKEAELNVGAVSDITGLNQKTQISDKTKVEKYFEVILQYPIHLCDDEEDLRLVATEAFQKMGTFPARDCIATIDGVVVVKMSEEPVFRF